MMKAIPAVRLFWASFLGLFLELALIRWFSTELRIFAYCKNMVLLACFLGLGLGCYFHDRRKTQGLDLLLLLALIALVKAPPHRICHLGPSDATLALSYFADFQIWSVSGSNLGHFLVGAGWTLLLFLMIAAILYPFGQLIGRFLGHLESALTAYTVNLIGALTGIWAFALLTHLETPPLFWFGLVAIGLIPFLPCRRAIVPATCLGIAAAAFLMKPRAASETELVERWSVYQKISVLNRTLVCVNNTGYMVIHPVRDLYRNAPGRWDFPYYFHEGPSRVLILGAGAGTDAAAALESGAESVVAVEIDPVIFSIGEEYHPQRPYSSERLRAVIDDARHYLATTEETFDVIHLGFLDSHTVLSGYTNVRLDNYIYTVESFRAARDRLAPGGILHLMFADPPDGWIAKRLHRNLRMAFDHEPVSFSWGVEKATGGIDFDGTHFLIGRDHDATDSIRRNFPTGIERLRTVEIDEAAIPESTDDWPYLYVPRRAIPGLLALLVGMTGLVSVGGGSLLLLRRRTIDWRFFWLGAGFLLVEFHNLSRLALVFGTTWYVNMWVISGILVMVLAANWTVARIRRTGVNVAYASLAASLFAAYVLPLGVLMAWPRLPGAASAVLVLSLPIYFAGIVFARWFATAPDRSAAFGSNFLGAVVGGVAENLSFVWGIRALVLVALGLYGLAAIAGRSAFGRSSSWRSGAA